MLRIPHLKAILVNIFGGIMKCDVIAAGVVAAAREVHLRLASPPITGPCLYGIDTPTREELIAATHSIEEIREFLGVDSLGYLSLPGMLRAAGSEEGYCHACFSGQYPTPIPGDLVQLRHASPLVPTPA